MPIKDWAESQGIKVLGLNYVRGRSLAKKFIIVDEAQNLSHLGIKTLITRAGEGTKIVIIGDVTQIDSPYQNEKTNGLSHVIDRMKGQPEFVHVHLTKGERSALADKAGRLL
jgi:PhoH-like ATPase